MVNRRSNGTQVRPYIRSSKPRFNWSDELKKLFDEAVRDLGCPRKATPKRIRELMRCSEIQLSHIKSRLQMCRIRMEEGRRSGSDSAQELLLTRKREPVDNVDTNGDEHSIVVDGNEHDQIYTFKRLRMEARSPSIQGSSGAATSQFYFDYFDTAQLKWRAVTEFSCDDLFRDEQLDAFKENGSEEGHSKENTKNDNLQLSLSLSSSPEKINLDLSMAILES
ncbi:protein PHR1-LIKE 2-like [Phalaenopsis equestris]|uniref:protein PHR1-LIKE 2-like n=1 Tax=Phalaenopsis equestris TaxID=78828 RepID=UPI0009E2F3A5|nr:protein PHR1-LIKE 2-like [Phalaenopsis equestris]